jgi:hypothetical protein
MMETAIAIVKTMFHEAVDEYNRIPKHSFASENIIARIEALGDVVIALRRAITNKECGDGR